MVVAVRLRPPPSELTEPSLPAGLQAYPPSFLPFVARTLPPSHVLNEFYRVLVFLVRSRRALRPLVRHAVHVARAQARRVRLVAWVELGTPFWSPPELGDDGRQRGWPQGRLQPRLRLRRRRRRGRGARIVRYAPRGEQRSSASSGCPHETDALIAPLPHTAVSHGLAPSRRRPSPELRSLVTAPSPPTRPCRGPLAPSSDLVLDSAAVRAPLGRRPHPAPAARLGAGLRRRRAARPTAENDQAPAARHSLCGSHSSRTASCRSGEPSAPARADTSAGTVLCAAEAPLCRVCAAAPHRPDHRRAHVVAPASSGAGYERRKGAARGGWTRCSRKAAVAADVAVPRRWKERINGGQGVLEAAQAVSER